ncbi:MAG: metallophosphoesterase [Bacteroidia bacterium]
MEEYISQTRRKFLKLGAGALSLAAIPNGVLKASEAPKDFKLTVLHTNDWHSRIDPFPDDDPKYPGLGGAARRASLIKAIRKENNNVLLLDAGDVFQGTPYFNYYGGEPEFKLMSEMGYDACTLGNHDFDNGIEGLVNMLPHANFPFVNCNYNFEGTALKGKIKKHVVLKKAGIRIGITGVGIDLKGLVPDQNHEGIHYNNPIECAEKQAKELKNTYGCTFVVCLSHLGFEYTEDKVSDRRLAAGTEHIDLIIGGHTHTFLDSPVIVSNKIGKAVTINQVGWAGLRLGRIDYLFSSCNNRTKEGFTQNKVFRKSIAI